MDNLRDGRTAPETRDWLTTRAWDMTIGAGVIPEYESVLRELEKEDGRTLSQPEREYLKRKIMLYEMEWVNP